MNAIELADNLESESRFAIYRGLPLREAARLLREMHEALEPFVRHMDEMKFDIDSNGNDLPDEQTVGWVYVTNGDFRRARKAYEAKP